MSNHFSSSQILELIKKQLESFNSPLEIECLSEICSKLGLNGHLAILHQPYLNKIISYQKTIESRFQKVKTSPFNKVFSKDILFLKQTSGSILSIAQLSKVDFFSFSNVGEVEKIIQKYEKELCFDEQYKLGKLDSKYATLMHIQSVLTVSPISVLKSDRRAWIVLNYAKQTTLF